MIEVAETAARWTSGRGRTASIAAAHGGTRGAAARASRNHSAAQTPPQVIAQSLSENIVGPKTAKKGVTVGSRDQTVRRRRPAPVMRPSPHSGSVTSEA